MLTPIKPAILLVIAATISGCSASYDQAAKMRPVGSNFDKALHAGYLKLAKAELDELDLTDTNAFATRAIMSGKGKLVPPEEIARRKLPEGKIAELATARERLVATLDKTTRDRQPKTAAQTQLAFECWMQEQEENFQRDDIAACRDRFAKLLAGMETRKKTAEARPLSPLLRAIPASATLKHKDIAQTGYVVLFNLNSADITRTGKNILDDAIATAKRLGAAVVRIAGHADRSGKRSHNDKLSLRRADKVSDAFTSSGIDGSVIRMESHGEDKPIVLTPDGKVEPRNRRVEIGIVTGGARTAKLR
jgi:OmpA-OmpF porin, OOP family